jgi:hypothetical protein
VNINSKAGIGKSYLITVLFSILSELAAIINKLSLLVRANFINIIAFSINS